VTAAGFVRPRENGLNQAQPARRTKTLVCQPVTGARRRRTRRRSPTHDTRADGDDASSPPCAADCRHRGRRDAIRFVERKAGRARITGRQIPAASVMVANAMPRSRT
jgi:hypothetical protein